MGLEPAAGALLPVRSLLRGRRLLGRNRLAFDRGWLSDDDRPDTQPPDIRVAAVKISITVSTSGRRAAIGGEHLGAGSTAQQDEYGACR